MSKGNNYPMGTREGIETQGVIHCDGYENLLPEEKRQIDAVIAFLSGKTIAEMKRMLGIARLELDFRVTLNRQPDSLNHQSPTQDH
jgi:hypothetical protein